MAYMRTADRGNSQRTYGAAIDTLEQVGKVVDSLYAKVRLPDSSARVAAVSDHLPCADCKTGIV